MTVDEKLLAFAHRLADASGAVIRPYFRQRIEVAHKPGKGAFDPVTEADKGGEKAIRAIFARVKSAVRMTRYCGDCYLFAVLAMGFVDIVIEAGFSRWDIAALIPIVEGAGGVITSWDGGDCRDGKTILACGDRRIHQEAMA